jgi:hypothetical protein
MFIRLDFPTLERPMKAYSGSVPAGHFFTSVLLMTNSALLISISVNAYCGLSLQIYVILALIVIKMFDLAHLF